ncbi:hypothetical protein RCL_jg4295.t1 [Rhizophagus clarus]|uniref:Uncharacterized protein n=1 Tax=Rhizophagus clarus TaxID=94130 RepID=A0A8H3KS98_9GLOM|nr:hypothetical protein RCL_jg4295.t1 [Rhizophagus clarus]
MSIKNQEFSTWVIFFIWIGDWGQMYEERNGNRDEDERERACDKPMIITRGIIILNAFKTRCKIFHLQLRLHPQL